MADDKAKLGIEISANGSQAVDALKNVKTEAKSLNDTVAGLTEVASKALLGFATFNEVVKIFKEVTSAAADDETAMALLNFAVMNTKTGTLAMVDAMEKMAKSMALTTGVSEDVVKEGLVKFTNATGNAQTAMTMMTTAVNLSKGAHKSLEESITLVTRAYEMGTTSLKRAQVYFDENYTGMEALTKINERYAGAVESVADTVETSTGKQKAAWKVYFEDLGGKIEWIIKEWNGFMTDVANGSKIILDSIFGTDTTTGNKRVDAINDEIKALTKKHDEIVASGKDYKIAAALEEQILKFEVEKTNIMNTAANGQNTGANPGKVKDLVAENEAKQKVNEEQAKIDQKNYDDKQKLRETEIAEIKRANMEAGQSYIMLGNTIKSSFEEIGKALVNGNMKQAVAGLLKSVVDSFIDAYTTVIQAHMALDIAAGLWGSIPVDLAQIGALSALKGAAGTLINKAGAANGVYDWRGSEPLITTLDKGESIVPKSMVDHANENGGMGGHSFNFHISAMDGASVENSVRQTILPAINKFLRQERGGILAMPDGTANF